MLRMLVIPILFLLLLGCVNESSENFSPLFDGTFKGWEGNMEFFRIEEEVIIAGMLTESIPQNEFLCTSTPYSDFELQLEAKLIGTGNNAGVQFRSTRIPDSNEVIGYQYDIGKSPQRTIWASLYDESRRKRFLIQPSEEKIHELLQEEAWNSLTIRCKENTIIFALNGEEVLRYEEPEEGISQSGNICLQIHSGPPAEAHYRNIRIKEF